MSVKPGDYVEFIGAEGVWLVDSISSDGKLAGISGDSQPGRQLVYVSNLSELPDVVFARLVEEARRERQSR